MSLEVVLESGRGVGGLETGGQLVFQAVYIKLRRMDVSLK